MAKVTVKCTLKVADLAIAGPDSTIKARIGEAVVTEMKQLIASGQSPVEGWGRFAEYIGVGRVKEAVAKARAQNKIAKSKGATQRISISNTRYDAQKKAYPYSAMKQYPDKQVRPVNLELSGEMLGALTYQEADLGVTIGIIGADAKVNVYAEAHNEGPTNGAFPQRKFLPTAQGETFVQSILIKIKDVYSGWLSDIIDRTNG